MKKKELLIWLAIGIITFIIGCFTAVYGFLFLIGDINGSIPVCLLLLSVCMVSIITCIMLNLKYKKKK